jgi:hypothetical protein
MNRDTLAGFGFQFDGPVNVHRLVPQMAQLSGQVQPWLIGGHDPARSFSSTASVTNWPKRIPRWAALAFARRITASGISRVVFMFLTSLILDQGSMCRECPGWQELCSSTV